MRRKFSLFPINKISSSLGLYQLPLKNTNISFSTDKNNLNSTNRKTSYPKSTKIQKMIEEINKTSPNPSRINNESTDLQTYKRLLIEEKMKNKNYSENIVLLTKHIEELESKIKNNNNPNTSNNYNNVDDEIMKLKQENKELKKFKEKVFSFSMKYDELNKDIINCLKSIEKIIEIYNLNDSSKNVECEKQNFEKISINFQLILDNLNNFITMKQDEYNMLLIEKDNEMKKLRRQCNDTNIDYFSNGLRSFRNSNTKINSYTSLNKNYKVRNQNNFNDFYKNFKTNEFNYENKKKKLLLFKSSFDNF